MYPQTVPGGLQFDGELSYIKGIGQLLPTRRIKNGVEERTLL